MIVLDASVVVELLTNGPLSSAIRIDIEVLSALRKLAAGRRIDAHRSREFLEALANLPAERYPHLPLMSRIWELRNDFTGYDAAYISLAEETGAVLYTCAEKRGEGHRARVVVFAG